VLPALGVLDRIELWKTTETISQTVAAPGGDSETETEQYTQSVPITLKDLGLALLAGLLTLISARNVPGFLEITFLQRLPLKAGERYAVTTVVRYIITAVGIVVAFNLIGVGWGKVQWLVAAVSVGLGFGLQEIFANFVSGLIILFERPIRIGDTVTVNNISGTVTRIQIRATTITDWSRKELIIPNKEFVTGQVINWTLSDSTLRIIVPVGIAYGSDTDLAEKLMLECAKEHPLVAEEPAAYVLFSAFGDNSLNFELRAYTADSNRFLTVTHDLHKAIDRKFRAAGIEIAFPQRDIHVRSIKDVLPITNRDSGRGEQTKPEGEPGA
jgi:potassium efflux system protein